MRYQRHGVALDPRKVEDMLVRADWVLTAYGYLAHIGGSERRYSKRFGREVRRTLCGRPVWEDTDEPVHGYVRACSVCVRRWRLVNSDAKD